MEYDVQDIKNLEKFGIGRGKRESSKNWNLRRFPKPNTISLRDYQMTLCILKFYASFKL